jgi:hypothetical protein
VCAIGRAEAAVLAALEQQRAVRQQRFFEHRLAHFRRHVAQVLADHHAVMAMTFQRQDAQHRR